ncbi:MAG: DUF4294 domain-containing protein [Prevotellaceae bacterium]|jgi:hypothetical protein|nr:DUF4294 domain-containing protein [Prevotellaceae bacterium]
MQRLLYIALLCAASKVCAAQGIVMPYTLGPDNDTIFISHLSPAYAFNRPPKNIKDKYWGDYYRIVYNFNKAYPFALVAAGKVIEIDSTLASKKRTTRERDKMLKELEKQLFKEFEKPLRNLTFSQGRMLLKLIDREVGQNSYYIIKDYRGMITAGFWQGIAKLFGADLKKPYDKYGDDKVLEELVAMYKDGSFPFLYASLFGK